MLPTVALAAGDANQSSCPAATESSPGFRTYLPDCRAYEQVSPPYKDGTLLEPYAISADGSHMLVQDFIGSFAHTEDSFASAYELSREGSGWHVGPVNLPASEFLKDQFKSTFSGLVTASSTLETTLWKAIPYSSYARVVELKRVVSGLPEGLQRLYERTTTSDGGASIAEIGPMAPYETASVGLNEVGNDANLTVNVLGTPPGNLDLALFIAGVGPYWPGDRSDPFDARVSSLYEYTGTGDTEPTLVAVSNLGRLEGTSHVNEGAHMLGQCGAELGSGRVEFNLTSSARSTYNAVSEDGSSVFFTVLAGEPGSTPGESTCAGGVQGGFIQYLAPFECKTELVSGSETCPASEATRVEHEIEADLQKRLEAGEIEDGTATLGKPYETKCGSRECEARFVAKAKYTAPGVDELYARTNQAKTLDLSEPPLAAAGRACTGACETAETDPANRKEGIFQGASKDGRKVFFLTEQPLVNEDTNTSADLYMEEIGCLKGESNCEPAQMAVTKLVDISVDSHVGEAAEVQGVTRISEDGSRAYFVAKGLLAGKNAEGKEPVAGADNLYVYEPDANHPGSSPVVFVTTLSAPDAEDWSISDFRPVQANGCTGSAGGCEAGRYLVFSSVADLTPDDTSTARQVFRYDARDGSLARVSVGQDGFNENGNISSEALAPSAGYGEFSRSSNQLTKVNVTEDGAVFFTSPDGLTPNAQNRIAVSKECIIPPFPPYKNVCTELYMAELGYTEKQLEEFDVLVPKYAQNVYEYRSGQVYLISDGQDAHTNDPLLGTDVSGGDVFVQSVDALVLQTADTQVNIYDAREDGGFPAPVLAPGCLGETCRGVTSITPQLGTPFSTSQAAGDNAKPPSKPNSKKVTQQQKLKKALAKCRKQYKNKTKKSKQKRLTCERQARKRYGVKAKAEAKTSRSRNHRKG